MLLSRLINMKTSHIFAFLTLSRFFQNTLTMTLAMPKVYGDNMTTQEASVRYQHLLQLLDRALLECRKDFDTDAAIKECYGDDASIFDSGASSDTNFLKSAIDAMVDRVNDKVKDQMIDFLEREKIKDRLAHVEAIINKLDRHDEEQKHAEAVDRDTAREALNAVRLPQNLFPAHVISHHAFKLMEEERDQLLAEIAKVETDTDEVNEKIVVHESNLKRGAERLEQMKVALQKSSDILPEESKSEE